MENYLTQITNYLLTQSWQIAVLVAIIAALSLALKNRSAHVRYLLWLIVLAKCLVPPLFTIPLAVLPQEKLAEPVGMPPVQAPTVAFEVLDTPAAEVPVAPATPVITAPTLTATGKPARLTTLQWLVFVWVAGVVVFLFFAVIKALRTNRWLRRDRKPLPAELQSGIGNLFSGLGIKTLPKVWLVEGIGQPFVWGLLRGSIYLPADFVKVNSAEHRRGVLGHELGHIVRFDAAVNILQIIAQAVFWFHPFVWWANRKIRAEREKCCDEMAIARLGAEAKDYSSAIVNILISEHESTRPVPSLAVAGPVKNIEERIKTMLRPGKKFYKHPSLVAVTFVLLLALLTIPTALVLTARAEIKMEKSNAVAEGTAEENPDKSELLESGKKVKCEGIVVNAKGEPVAGARVRLYELLYGQSDATYSLAEEVMTKADGAFRFSISTKTSGDRHGHIVARKQGLAIGWGNWGRMLKDHEVVINLDEPKELTGIVVDETGKPIMGAKVSINALQRGEWGTVQPYLVEPIVSDLFTVKTDSEGRFTFSNLPAEAAAEFLVKKKGKATIATGGRGPVHQFRPGQKGIRIEMPVEAKIEGIVVEKGSGKPVVGVALKVTKQNMYGNYIPTFPPIEPSVSTEGGSFVIPLAPGKYRLQVVADSNKTADWVAEPLEVTMEAGKTKADVRVEMSKGGILEVVVTDAATKKPIENATVRAMGAGNRPGFRGESDKDGIARIRLLPGQYGRIAISKQGYRLESRRGAFLIEDGKTEHIELPLTTQPKITGVVRDEAGKALGSAKVGIARHAFGVRWADTDAKGRFEISWKPMPTFMQKRGTGTYLIARDQERNLAKIVKIDEDTEMLDIKLKPGVVLIGRVVGPDHEGIAYARICVRVRLSDRDRGGVSTVAEKITDSEGSFEVKAMFAEHVHVVFPSAEGYGQQMVEVDPGQAVGNRIELKPSVLPVANRSVSGLVVDTENKPMAGAYIIADQGDTSLYRETRADTDGKFTVEKICDGSISIHVIAADNPRLGERIKTEAGAADVKIVVTER